MTDEAIVEVAIDDLEASNVRCITPDECDLLIGFDRGYTAIDEGRAPDSPRYKADGNSWISNKPEWAMSRIEQFDRRDGTAHVVVLKKLQNTQLTCAGNDAMICAKPRDRENRGENKIRMVLYHPQTQERRRNAR